MKIFLLAAVFLGTAGLCAAQDTSSSFSKAKSFEKANEVFQVSCMPCHSAQTPVPWYGRLPVMSSAMKKEYRSAIKGLNLDDDVYLPGKKFDPETLDKIESVIQKGSMPPLDFRMRHWKARLSKKEKQAILDWISDERIKLTALAAEAELLQRAVPEPVFQELSSLSPALKAALEPTDEPAGASVVLPEKEETPAVVEEPNPFRTKKF
ncbi:MAG TPA: heme-binding domain-containing protein [Candidatus Omnitrophota bacterium]|nr:heme-binding domain-containing protein [Candidatus Omnitrophota bacterium]